MSIEIQQKLVRDQTHHTYGGTNPCNYLTVHQTGNVRPGADAEGHADLQYFGNVREASWHCTVDDHSAWQSYLDSRQCWHAGDGVGRGNTQSWALELCINSDGDYVKTIENGADVVRQKMLEHNIPITRVLQHNYWSSYGKNCPAQIRGNKEGIDWPDFLAMVLDSDVALPVAKPKPRPTPFRLEADGYWGRNTTTAFQVALGTNADGEIWNQWLGQRDRNPGLTTGWMWNTTEIGSPAIQAAQVMLKADGQYNGKLDGLCGPVTIQGLQKRFLGTVVDSHLSAPSRTIEAMQIRLRTGKF